MGQTVTLGVGGVEMEAGAHICAFHRGGTDRDSLLLSYFREGLLAGDKCLGLIDSTPSTRVISLFDSESQPIRDKIPRHLEVMTSADSYLTDGHFSTRKMIAWLTENVGRAIHDEGFPVARAAGEMTWALRSLPGVDELCAYESELNRYLPSFPQVLLCMYDLERFDGHTIVDVMKTHPHILVGGVFLENPYYIPPDELLADRTNWSQN